MFDDFELPPKYRKKSKTARRSNVRKRADHKHDYEKMIVRDVFGFFWGRKCRICGKINDSFKISDLKSDDFTVTESKLSGEWRDVCLQEKDDWHEWTDAK